MTRCEPMEVQSMKAAGPIRMSPYRAIWVPLLVASCVSTGARSIDVRSRDETFKGGDSINIESVSGPDDRFSAGTKYTIRGNYSLSSRDEALLAFYITNGKVSGSNRVKVRKGKGKFEFRIKVEEGGLPHLSFYPSHRGSSFGGSYLSTKHLEDHGYARSGSAGNR